MWARMNPDEMKGVKRALDTETSWHYKILVHILVATLAVACYSNSLCGDFVFDDSEAILKNKDVDPYSTSLWQVFQNDFWGTKISSNLSHKSYRPLTIVTFRLNYWLAGGLEPFGFHLANVILHVLVSLLYLEVCTAVCKKSSLDGAHKAATPIIAALLFAVHPVHTENVAGIVGRAELMSALCFFLAFLCYMRSCDGGSRWCSMICWLLFTNLLVCFALLFKEQGITVLGVCIVYDIIVSLKADPKDIILQRKLPASKEGVCHRRMGFRVLVVIAAGLVMFAARLSTGSPTFKPIDNAASFAESIATRVLTYNYIYALNVWLLLNPWWLCFDWSMGCVPLLDSFTDYRILIVIAFWVPLCALILHCLLADAGPLKRVVTMALAMLVIPFLPASNIFIRVGFVVAERVLYLPSAGYCLLVALGIITSVKQFGKRVWSGVIFVVVIFTLRSMMRSSQWVDEEKLFVSGITICPKNAKVLYNIGKVRSDAGDMTTGTLAYREAIRLNPEYDQALNNLGNILKDQGDPEEAERLFLRALSCNPEFPAAWMNLGIAQATLKKFEEAEVSYKTAIRHRKKYPDAFYNLGNLYKDTARHSDAIEAYETAITLEPGHTSAWNNIALLYEDLKMLDKAEEVLGRAISKFPNHPQFYSSLGILLGKQNRLEEGQKLLERAVSLNPKSGNYLANLGVVYHLRKDYKKAEEAYSKALTLEPNLTLAKENFNKLMSVTKAS